LLLPAQANNGALEVQHSTPKPGNPRPVPAELPAPGYPVSEEAVEYWFRGRYGCAPTEQEIGAIIGAMAQREATPPRRGPDASAHGWVMGPVVRR
jgi:hypothetical protein